MVMSPTVWMARTPSCAYELNVRALQVHPRPRITHTGTAQYGYEVYDCCPLCSTRIRTLAPLRMFQKLSAFSGRYDLTMQAESFSDLFNGYYDENIYFHTPTHFLPNLDCEWRLRHLRQMDIVLVIGKEDPFLGNNHYLSQILYSKGIRHQLHEWNERAHRGHYWRCMAPLYV